MRADTNWRNALELGLKLAVTLCFMASGDNFCDLAYSFRVPHDTISMFLSDVFLAIVAEYGDEALKMPSDEDEWHVVIDKFSTRWKFPNTIRAI